MWSDGSDMMVLNLGLGQFRLEALVLGRLFLIKIYMVWIDSLESDYGNLLVMNYHEFS